MPNRSITIPGPVGNLEAIIRVTDTTDYSNFGIVCHPHPLKEGTMHNKVVSTLVKFFDHRSFPSVRFNFRGVGASDGEFGDIYGEVEDCLAVAKWVKQQHPTTKIWLAGFSFGAYVAADVASQINAEQLITVAPSVERMPYDKLGKVLCPWLVIMGDQDEVVEPQAVFDWYDKLEANKSLIKFPDATHFFHGQLIKLQEELQQHYSML